MTDFNDIYETTGKDVNLGNSMRTIPEAQGIVDEVATTVEDIGEDGLRSGIENFALRNISSLLMHNPEDVPAERDGIVVGLRDGQPAAGLQEQIITQENGANGEVISRNTTTYGAYVEADGDVDLRITKEGFQNYENGELSYGATLNIGTEAVEGSAHAIREWENQLSEGASGITGYAVSAGVNFEKEYDGSETNWNAAVLGEATYENDMLRQFGTYAFVEGGITADPSGLDPVARAGIGKEVGAFDVRGGVTQDGGASFTTNFNF